MEHSKQETEKRSKKIEQDLTYTVEGDFTDTSIEIKICLPDDSTSNLYNFESYNVSTSNKNAVLIHLKQSNTNARLRWDGSGLYNIDPISTMDHDSSQTNFNFLKESALILVFHEDNLSQGDIDSILHSIDDLYEFTDGCDGDRTIMYWPSSLKGPTPDQKGKDEKFVPRVVGMTIIRKRGSV